MTTNTVHALTTVMRQAISDGHSHAALVAILNDQGVRTQRGKSWHKGNLQRFLRRHQIASAHPAPRLRGAVPKVNP